MEAFPPSRRVPPGASAGRGSVLRPVERLPAAKLFYAEGIHTVGIDRIVAEAQVTRATLYRHFPGKEELVLAYLTEAGQAVRDLIDQAAVNGSPAADTVRAISRSIAQGIQSAGFRGCAFLNAVAEYPDPRNPGWRGDGTSLRTAGPRARCAPWCPSYQIERSVLTASRATPILG
ncbi:TetR/AcrR family transcriptional regulator [Lentzea sp. E54]|uniref:TetR/AcrR family transcriptional regulator n=1 Tax=Lentzea xerophila TaxID=3435883 RepID=UPI003DA34C80